MFSISLSAAIPAKTEFHCHGFMKYGIPGKADQYLCREGYSVGYNYKRHDDFRPDPAIPYQYQAQLSDYKRSGYDRRHLHIPGLKYTQSNIC
ncbi:hypothetical protein [Piscirickettsia salmonis]